MSNQEAKPNPESDPANATPTTSTARNFEIDFAVAEAAGIEIYPADGHRTCVEVFIDGGRGARRRFSPSTNLLDAMEAAEAVGLFVPNQGAGVLRQIPGTNDGWTWMIEFYRVGFVKANAVGATPELAICEAIPALEKK